MDVMVTEPQSPLSVRLTFSQFYMTHWERTVRLAHLLGVSTSSAEDVAQDAMLRLRPRYEAANDAVALLNRITINVVRSRHRADVRRLAREDVSPGTTPTDQQSSADLMAAVRHLPHRQRAVLVLRYWLDLSEAEIAVALKCRPGTVKSNHHRALAALRNEDLQ